ncbi:MAG: hypothetical protein HY708_05720, partial [Ignavibacteriae bacterium]|nr:hypothetical protein [Ignavibacteriota bacterium]
FDVLGREVATLVNEVYPVNGVKEPGTHEVIWGASPVNGASGVASGVYFYRLTAGDFIQTRKAILLR